MDDRRSDRLSLSDSDSDALFDTPAARDDANGPDDAAAASKPRANAPRYTSKEDRDAALRAELESVRNVNKVIEGVVESLQKAKSNMDVRNPHVPVHLPSLVC
jgi:hypothetical protein